MATAPRNNEAIDSTFSLLDRSARPIMSEISGRTLGICETAYSIAKELCDSGSLLAKELSKCFKDRTYSMASGQESWALEQTASSQSLVKRPGSRQRHRCTNLPFPCFPS